MILLQKSEYGMFESALGLLSAFVAAASALSLPGMPTWLGIQKRMILLPFVSISNL